MKKAVIVFSGGVDSVCAVSFLKSKYELYGITFSYGQKANMEISAAKSFAKKLGLKDHKIIDIGFMKNLYGNSNVLTSSKR
ncbi:MAG: 7-cyano-7-deazaguanine synthase, partial [Nitrosopumilus sp.]|nr:7-cyano-7-deazaguanine synthase [Nitrosopumilus sp.]